MSRFLVMYLVPVTVIEDWKKTDDEIRRPQEEKMRAQWGEWMQKNSHMFVATEAAGRTKRVSADGVSDHKNDLMLYSIVEADSHDEVADLFADHPHLQIPRSSIEITEVRAMGPQA
jgi:hypothetical protein